MKSAYRRSNIFYALALAGFGFSQPGIGGEPEFKSDFWYQDKAGADHMSQAHDLMGKAFAVGDFNGDGFEDLATGVPGEEVNHERGAGAVHVNYGRHKGLSEHDYQLWHLDKPYVQGAARAGDNYGKALAAGDFNRDGYDDLAVGIPYRDVGSAGSAGAIHVLYGSPDGLSDFNNRLWHQDSSQILGGAEPSDNFGLSLAAADFDGDGTKDLAVGVPGEDIDNVKNAGAVNVLLGSHDGLTGDDNQMWYQGREIAGTPEAHDRFGYALSAGHFDADRYADLAVGVPGEDLSPGQLAVYYENVGAVQVLYGTRFGLSGEGSEVWHQDSDGIDGSGRSGDGFGTALTSGDYDGDTYDDLAVGAPYKAVSQEPGAGAVTVIYGATHGLRAHRSRQYHQDNHNLPGAAEQGDHFGLALTSGDLDGDGFDDLTVGHPDEDLYSRRDGGAAITISGSSHGLKRHSHQLWHQNVDQVGSSVEEDDRFGLSLAAGDFDGNGADDLVIGVPYEDIDHIKDAGAFHIFYRGGFTIQFGLSGAWSDPDTPDQGFMIEVIADTNMLLVKWFTYAGEDESYGDERDQRWYTSLMEYDGSTAKGAITSTYGGAFEEAALASDQENDVGYLEMEFSGCATGKVSYELDSIGRSGQFPIEKVTGASPACLQN